ncbi:YeeE/YedE family protein [Pseudohalocynthiibacter aestuariivivens]|uniref:YeeE/YedE family protein n=1 Tax=Roseovarius pelagicus TaxID=2980108 RepID=A0ABY6DCD6_9RHOB|nr:MULTISPECIES: YeeE/YedE family protein [Rhodobacterales]QIE45242.1 YeeE/YedE family protein [Pseudohalocynthiibacter aestuariivivens]UXX82848.1 YeeE/YedE family protein [Roseovarius pelagicus]
METVFTPWQSLAGGSLIGLAATLLMLSLGRIFGATGILSGLIAFVPSEDRAWRVALLLGMVSGPLVVMLLSGQMPVVQVPTSAPMLVIGGLAVGVGVTFGSGCTSGHGVCGMARLSRRSFAAVLTFMITTAITVYILRHGIGV